MAHATARRAAMSPVRAHTHRRARYIQSIHAHRYFSTIAQAELGDGGGFAQNAAAQRLLQAAAARHMVSCQATWLFYKGDWCATGSSVTVVSGESLVLSSRGWADGDLCAMALCCRRLVLEAKNLGQLLHRSRPPAAVAAVGMVSIGL